MCAEQCGVCEWERQQWVWKHVAGTCFQPINLVTHVQCVKACPIYGRLPCWNGHPLMLMTTTVPCGRNVRAARRRRACFDATKLCAAARMVCAHHKNSKMALCATSSSTLGEVTAPWCFCQAKLLQRSSIQKAVSCNRPNLKIQLVINFSKMSTIFYQVDWRSEWQLPSAT